MSNFVARKNRNMRFTRHQNENVVQELRKTAKNLDGIGFVNEGACKNTKTPLKAKETTKVTSKSKKVPTPDQLEILSVKEDNGQIVIEFRGPSTGTANYATQTTNQIVRDKLAEIKVEDEIEFGEPSISVQTIPAIYAERNNYQIVAIKVEDELHVKLEDDVEFCSQSSTAQLIPGTDDEEHNNQSIQDQFREIDKPNFVKTHDTNPISFTCEICSKMFSTKSNLNKHLRRHDKPNFNCNVCGVAKFTHNELSDHLTTHHTNTINFSCNICSKKYSSKSNLNRHKRLHGKPILVCKNCGVPKSSKWDLNRHMKSHKTERD